MTGLSLASLYDTMHTLERVLGGFPVMIIATDSAGRMVMTSKRARDALCLAEVDLLDRPVAAIVPGLSISIAQATGDDIPRIDIGPARRRALRRDGTAFPVDIKATAHRLGDDVICLFALLDVTERLQTDHALRDSQSLHKAILEGLPAMVAAKTPDGVYEFINAYQASVFGIEPNDAVGHRAGDLLGAEAGGRLDDADERLADGTVQSNLGSERLIDADGQERTFMVTRSAMRDPKGQVKRILNVGIDITHATVAERRIERLSLMDDMTGLPNRSAAQQILGAQIRGAERDTRRIGLILIRILNLSDLAEDLGEIGRDAVVRRLAIRLGGLVSDATVLSRFDDTTFALIVPDPDDLENLQEEAARLVVRAGRPINAAGSVVTVQCRAGFALYPETAFDAEALFYAAEHALRSDTRSPVAAPSHANGDFASYLAARRGAVQSLRQDIEQHRLRIRLLPIRALDDQRLMGFQTCLFDSLDRPLLGLPGGDTGAAMGAAVTGLAADLCEHMLRAACHIAAEWRRLPCITVPLTTGALLNRSLVDLTEDALRRSGMPAHRLRLAVDEVALVDGPGSIADVLDALADLGAQLCLSNFGTGGYPLLDLGRLPFGHVMLRSTSIGPLDGSVAAAIGFARSLGRSVGAEAVRSPRELAFLRKCGCKEASGPAFGGPLDPDEARALPSRLNQTVLPEDSAAKPEAYLQDAFADDPMMHRS